MCRAVFFAVWKPFTWLVGYRDPRKPDLDVLHGDIITFLADHTLAVFMLVDHTTAFMTFLQCCPCFKEQQRLATCVCCKST